MTIPRIEAGLEPTGDSSGISPLMREASLRRMMSLANQAPLQLRVQQPLTCNEERH